MLLTLALTGLGALTLAVILAVIIVMVAKRRVDKTQEEWIAIGNVLERDLGLKGAGKVFYKLGAGNIIGARAKAKALWDQYGTADQIDDLVARIVKQALPKLLEHPEHKVAIGQLIAERLLPFKLDAQTKAELVMIQTRLDEWGMPGLAAAALAIATDQPEVARAQILAIATDLRTDEGTRSRAKKVLRKLVPELMEKAEDAEWLRGLVGTTFVSVEGLATPLQPADGRNSSSQASQTAPPAAAAAGTA